MLNSPYILVLFASRNGSTKSLAESISRGIRQCPGMDVCFRTVPSIEQIKKGQDKCAETGAAFVTVEEFAGASALALGSPTQFGNMSSSLQYFLEQTTSLWFKGALVDKPVAVFTSTASLHGGQETTLINMLTPLSVSYTHLTLPTKRIV